VIKLFFFDTISIALMMMLCCNCKSC